MAVLLSALASTYAWAASPDTELVDAAKNGDLAEVKDALSAGARINTNSGPTALLECLGTQQFDHTKEMIQLLLAHGADINVPGPDGLSAFQLVLNSWYCDDYLPLLLPLHPDFKATTKDGDGVVALAIRRGALQLARSMLDQGAPSDLPNLAGITPLMLAAQGDRNQAWRESEYVDMANVLLSKGADPVRTDKTGKNASDYALDNNNYDLLILLDSNKAHAANYNEVKKADLAQKLSATVERDRWSKIKVIGGPKVAQIDTRGIITSLLKDGADPNAPAVGQPTTIFGQALGDRLNGPPFPPDPGLIQLLLDHGANPNQTFADGNVPLALTVAQPAIFEMLIAKGADPKALITLQTVGMNPSTGGITQEKSTQSIIDVAATKGTVETMRFLLDRKVDFNQPDSEGMTPLLLALANGNTDVARLLIDRGARVDVKSTTGQTAADLAASSLDVGLLRKLDQSGKYASLLSEYPPLPNAPILGAWMIGPDGPTAPLRLDPDGGGVLGLRGAPRAIEWKSVGAGYELSGIQLVGNFQMPMPFKAKLTPGPADKTLALEIMPPGGSGGAVLIFHRPGDPVPAQSEIFPSGNPPAPGSDAASVIAEALTAHPQSLSLTERDLTEFPAAAYQLIGLTHLNVNSTKLAVIPSQIGKFRLLEQVSFRANQINTIEDGFYDLVNLTDLDLGTNRLATVSPRLGGLTKLTSLMLDDNRIADLPDVWDKMTCLKTLSLGENRLSKLPRTLALAPQLSVLGLNDNMLSDLPEEWGKFALEYLNLSQNRFTSFPKEIWNIQIHRLEMINNEITEIPPELASEAGLEQLDLSGNLITTIPDLSQTHLTELRLSNNRIKSFPADKSAFPATLRELNLSRNEITEIPDWVFDLNLQSLTLEGNPMPEETIRSAEQRVRQGYEMRRLQNHNH